MSISAGHVTGVGALPIMQKLADLVAEVVRLHGEEGAPRPADHPVRAAVLLVDDRPLLAQGVRRVLEVTPDLRLAGRCSSMAAVPDQVRDLRVDLVLLNPLTGGCLTGPEVCRRLRVNAPHVRILVLAEGGAGALLTACHEAGAHGVLPVAATEEELVGALRETREAVPPGPVGVPDAGACVFTTAPGGAVTERLRPREYDVLRLLAGGAATTEVADRLGITTNTVRSYTQSLMAKLQTHNRVQLIVTAGRLGLL